MKISKIYIFLIGITLSFALIIPVSAQNRFDVGDDKYTPSMGQSGKDVIWIPTGNDLVSSMLKIAEVTPKDLVYDLGAGDGKIAIAAAKEFGANAIGIEFNPDMAALAQRNANRAGVGNKVKIINGDIFVEDFSKATVVTLYLLPHLNIKLRPIILNMKPGTRIASHAFNMGDWEPDKEIDSSMARGYFWVVPAKVEGNWALTGIEPQSKVVLNLAQRYQKIGGVLTIGNTSQSILNAQISGDKLSFGYIDRNQQFHTAIVKVNGSELIGHNKGENSDNEIVGKRF